MTSSLPIRTPLRQDEQRVLDHMPLVRAIAGGMRASVPPSVDLDDLVQAGVLGLLDAVSKYNPDRPIEFRTYAKHRIRGAILDSLRKLDMAPRMLRQSQRKVEAATRELTATNKREPTETEVADALGIAVEALRKTKAKVDGLNFISVSPGAVEHDGVEGTFEVTAKFEDGPEDHATHWELNRLLTQTISQLPARQQEVVRLYYNQDLTMREIGTSLGVNESRISQIHTRAIANLGKILGQAGISSVRAFAA